MEGEGAGKDDEVNSPLQQKESTAKSGCATKDQDARLPGKSDRDPESAKARRYVAREIAVTLEGAEKVER